MADRYLSSYEDNSEGRENQPQGGSGRKSRKRRIRVTQNGQPDGDYTETPALQPPIRQSETVVERTTRRVRRPAGEAGYVSSSSTSRGYDDYLDDDYIDDDELLDDVLLDDRLVDEVEIRERRTTARRPARTTSLPRRSSSHAQYQVDNGYEDSGYEEEYEQTYAAPRSRTQYDDRGYAPRTNLRPQMPNMALPRMSLPSMSMPRRPRMPQLPMRGGLSDLVGRGRVAMAILMGLLAFIGYSISNNSTAVRAASTRQRPQRTETRYVQGTNTPPVNLVTQHDIAFGALSAGDIINRHGGLSQNQNLRVRVKQIGNRLAKSLSSAQTAFPFQFDVLADTQTVAAYDVPGGQVYLTAGLVEQLNDDEIAAILAHEMAHITKRHTVSRLAQTRLSSGAQGGVVMASLVDPTNFSSTRSDVSQLIRESTAIRYNSRETRLADDWAIGCLLQSQFNPNALTTALQGVNQVNGRATSFAARHESAIDRYAVIQQQIGRYIIPSGT